MRGNSFAKPDKKTVISVSPFQGAMGTIHFDAEGECRVPLQVMKREAGKTIPLTR